MNEVHNYQNRVIINEKKDSRIIEWLERWYRKGTCRKTLGIERKYHLSELKGKLYKFLKITFHLGCFGVNWYKRMMFIVANKSRDKCSIT